MSLVTSIQVYIALVRSWKKEQNRTETVIQAAKNGSILRQNPKQNEHVNAWKIVANNFNEYSTLRAYLEGCASNVCLNNVLIIDPDEDEIQTNWTRKCFVYFEVFAPLF